MNIKMPQKQNQDIGACYDLLQSPSGVIEAFFIKPDGITHTKYFSNKTKFVQSVIAHNTKGFTCYAGLQPRRKGLLAEGTAASGADVTALRILAVDLDACKPRDEQGNKLKVNANDAEKQACLQAAQNISSALSSEAMGYRQPILVDSGSGCWLFMPIPEIEINAGNRREIAIRLKAWGACFQKHFQQEGIEIDPSIFDLHRLTKIPGTKVFTYADEPDRPQRVSAFLSDITIQADEKLRNDFLSMPVEIPPERTPAETSIFSSSAPNINRILDRCHLMKFLAAKGGGGVSMPHEIRLGLSTFSLALGDLDNNLAFSRLFFEGSPDFSEGKTRKYLELNKEKAAPYGCDALRELVMRHMPDFDASLCQCKLPVSLDASGTPHKPSPIRFAGIMPEDLSALFGSIKLSGDAFDDYTKLKQFAEATLTAVDKETARAFLESQKADLALNQQAINDLLKARKAALPQEDQTQSQRLVELAVEADLFHDLDGNPFATFKVDEHYETWQVKSKGFKNHLKHRFYQETSRPPSAQAIQDALGVIEAKAQFEGKEKTVHIRVAGKDDSIYIDMTNDRWEVIEVNPSGWQIIQHPPVKFRRTKGMAPLPYPTDNGSLEALRQYLNLLNPEDFRLIVGWLISVLKGTGPYPVLVLTGEQGSAKTTVGRILKALVDSATSPLRTTPKEVRDLMIAANNGWVIAFDNLSGLPIWISDAICRLATGGGFSTRTLYEDDEESIFNATRAIILNSIDDIVTRHDLADRSIIINLKPIPADQRMTEKDLWDNFNDDAPGILGALLSAVSCALRNIGATKLDRLPRMADFATWVVAAEGSLPWEPGEFMKQYDSNASEAVELALDADILATAVRSLMVVNKNGWKGTATELLKYLNDKAEEQTKRQKQWPKAANALMSKLKRSATALRTSGIEIETSRDSHGGARTVKIFKGGDSTCRVLEPSSEPSPAKKEIIDLHQDVIVIADAADDGGGKYPSSSISPGQQEPVGSDDKTEGKSTSYQKNNTPYLRMAI